MIQQLNDKERKKLKENVMYLWALVLLSFRRRPDVPTKISSPPLA